MPKLIDKERAYTALKHEQYTHGLSFSAEAFEKAARIIDQMPTIEAEPVNRWIPVEDALPEKAGNYLCTLFYTIPPYNLFHPEKDTYIREVSVKFFDGKSFIASVVAWMPMPDAYEPPEKE